MHIIAQTRSSGEAAQRVTDITTLTTACVCAYDVDGESPRALVEKNPLARRGVCRGCYVLLEELEVKAAVLTSFREPLEIREFPRPRLGPGELLVRITAAGVCGSDVHMWLGEDPRTPLPMILGHEGVGVVEEIGSPDEKKDIYGRPVRVGDPIIWDRAIVCGTCYFCAVKQLPNMCPSRWVYGIHRGCSEPPHLNGCYAEYIVLVRGTKVVSLADWSELDHALLVSAGCSGATAANAIELADVEIGDNVLIQGVGPLGLYLVAYARARGANRIIAIDGVPARLELAKRLGADILLNLEKTTPEERREAVLSVTHGIGVDAGFEAVGRPEPILEGLQLVRRGGAYVSVGTAVPAGTIPVDVYYHLVLKQVRLQGAWTNDTRHMIQALNVIRREPDVFGSLITHRFPLERANEALEVMRRREAIKAVIEPER
ncbi:MAG: zinc-binding dehydrogenase [Armatimonadota bacterium]|nr:zinc-binding dehydrogenase [Armatimonadota bacterium]